MPTPETIKPYDNSRPKTEQVEEMFDSIAPAYDFMNRAMTFGIDKLWRRRAVKLVAATSPRRILDVATGTGDLAIRLARAIPSSHITGIDLSEEMLRIGRRKTDQAGLTPRIELTKADCLALPFPDASFDAVTVAYGVRNFEHLDQGYAEMARVLRPRGILCVIELAVPTNPVVRPLYNLYTRRIIPTLGRLAHQEKDRIIRHPRLHLPPRIHSRHAPGRTHARHDAPRRPHLPPPPPPHLRHLRHLHRPQTLTPPPTIISSPSATIRRHHPALFPSAIPIPSPHPITISHPFFSPHLHPGISHFETGCYPVSTASRRVLKAF